MSAIRGLFKSVAGDEPAATNPASTNPNENASAEAGKGVSGFLSGTTNFFSSVQAKKDDFMSDLTNKLGNLTPSFGEETKAKKPHGNDDSDNDSSASEYGDGGDKPVYAGLITEERRRSLESIDSLPEDETKKYKQFLEQLVEDIFDKSTRIPESKKSTFTSYVKHHTGRSNFSKTIDKKRSIKQVESNVMQKLVEYFSIILVQCNEAEDFRPARLLMNLCFTFYTEIVTNEGQPVLTYLYTHLKEQALWQSIRFWNAAFFEALGHERAKKPEPTTDDVEKALIQDKEFHENVAYGQLSTFTWNMIALGLSREVVLEFLRKQAAVANLPRDKSRLIRANIQKWTS